MNPLVSEDESSSTEVSQLAVIQRNSPIDPGAEGNSEQLFQGAFNSQPDNISSSSSDNSDDSDDNGGNEFNETNDNGEGDDNDDENDAPPDIKNEMVQSKITTTASVLLTKLPPSSNDLLSRLTKPVADKSKLILIVTWSCVLCYNNLFSIIVTIRCQAIGSAPEINPKVFKISYSQPFATLIKFLTKKLRRKLASKEDVIYCYVNNSFSPSPDEIIGDLFKVSLYKLCQKYKLISGFNSTFLLVVSLL